MEEKKINWLSIISLAATILLSIFKDETNLTVIYPLIGVILIVLIINMVLAKTKRNRNLSNTAVITKTKKYTNYLLKLVKASGKQIKKEIDISELKLIEKYNKKILRQINGKDVSDKTKDEFIKTQQEKQELIIKYVKRNNKYVTSDSIKTYKPVEKMLSISNESQTTQIYNHLYSSIKDLERILLQLEQHKLRIKFGKYVVKSGINIDHTIHAYVDLIGWTHVLLGDNKKGLASIQCGLDLIDYKLNSLPKNSKDYYECLYQKARALRHMGTTYYTYRTPKDKFVKEKLLEAIGLLSTKDVIEYYYSSMSLKEKYEKMMSGLKYNVLLYDYYVALEKKDQFGEKLDIISQGIDKLYEEIQNSDVEDNHRLVKVLTFKNQIDKNIIMRTATLKDDNCNLVADQLRKDLSKIEQVLNKNIYFDEAMEVYICQKVQDLYSKIEDVFE